MQSAATRSPFDLSQEGSTGSMCQCIYRLGSSLACIFWLRDHTQSILGGRIGAPVGSKYTGPVSSIHLYSALNSAPPSRSWMSAGFASATGTSCSGKLIIMRAQPDSAVQTGCLLASADTAEQLQQAAHRLAAPQAPQLRQPAGAGEGGARAGRVYQLFHPALHRRVQVYVLQPPEHSEQCVLRGFHPPLVRAFEQGWPGTVATRDTRA